MKIQKLIIHNIASIEDATIDFEKNPLADSEVFLITGKTGSGKSTILDAICLALYANTPRLKNTKMQGKVNDVDNIANAAADDKDKADKSIQIDDPRQLMRRNTGEAFASLTFIGKNDVHYEARWTVARAHKKTNGKLQSKTWTLTNLDTNKVLNKDKEIAQEINAAIGLDFQQFCRTTMLAQGDFTRFLNSEDNEKAAILEKITGLDIYSKIGAKVYELTTNKRKDWEHAQQFVEGTITFSADEIEERKLSLANLDIEYNEKKKQRDEDGAKRDWLKKETELLAAVKAADTEFQKAKEITESDNFKQKETLVKEWNATIEARNFLLEGRNAQTVRKNQEEALRNLSNKYALLLGGHKFAEQEAAELFAKIKNIETFLSGEKDKTTVYENAQTIGGQLNNVMNGRNVIAKNKDDIEKEQKKLQDNWQPAYEKAQKAEASARDAIKQQEVEVDELAAEVEKLKLSDLRTRSNESQQLIANIGIAKERLKNLADAELRWENVRKNLETRRNALEEKKKQSSALDMPLNNAKLMMDSKREDLDKQKDTVDKFAKALRQKLQIGEICPVCRQKLTSELPHEEELSVLISGLEELYQEAEKNYNELNTKKVNLEAEIKAAQTSYTQEKDAFDRDTSVANAKNNALDACQKCDVMVIDEQTVASLDTLEKKTIADKKALDEKIKSGEEKEKVVKDLRDVLDKKRKDLDGLKEETNTAEKAVNDCKARIETAQKLISSKQKEVQNAEKQIRTLLGTTVWKNNWSDNLQEFSEELTAAAQTYHSNVNEKQTLESDYRWAKENCDNVSGVISEILAVMPQWKEILPANIEKSTALLKTANDINTAVATELDKLNTAVNTYNQRQKQLDDFMLNHAEITIEKLDKLNSYTSAQILQENDCLENYRTDAAAKKGSFDSFQNQYQAHQQNKPVLTQDDTLELLEVRITETEKTLREITEKKGAINQELVNDENNKKKKADLIEAADKKKTDYQKWSRLNQLIGDATGNVFRRIAQSYVLANLVHSANHYMSTLTDRYSLKVQPGTFVILIEDAYQGFATRAVSTISGGESFLVSLALALALSDIGQSLSVDTLFIDEGFGTLSGEPLQNAVNTLRTLQIKAGRHVGIISHVEELQERIPVQIQVVQNERNSSSKINIVS